VRLNAEGVNAIIGIVSHAVPTSIEAAADIATELPNNESRSPVSDAALKAWYEAYKLAYSGNSDTEASAIKSASGCFPDKAVSRQKIRDLRGEQKRGRKPRDDT